VIWNSCAHQIRPLEVTQNPLGNIEISLLVLLALNLIYKLIQNKTLKNTFWKVKMLLIILFLNSFPFKRASFEENLNNTKC